jgi:hypothetical protein
MDLYSSELSVKINAVDACTSDKFLELGQHIIAWDGTEIREIYL